MAQGKRPWQVLRIHISVTLGVGIIAYFFAAVLIFLSYWQPQYQDTWRFVALAVTAAAAVTSAAYVGKALRENVESAKLGRTMDLAARWNVPAFFHTRKAILEVAATIKDVPLDRRAAAIQQEFAKVPDRENNVRDALNFLEELARFIQRDAVEEEVLRDFYQTLVLRYYTIYEPWIQAQRDQRGPRVYKSLLWLYTRWQEGK